MWADIAPAMTKVGDMTGSGQAHRVLDMSKPTFRKRVKEQLRRRTMSLRIEPFLTEIGPIFDLL
jgi:hypothetical protein